MAQCAQPLRRSAAGKHGEKYRRSVARRRAILEIVFNQRREGCAKPGSEEKSTVKWLTAMKAEADTAYRICHRKWRKSAVCSENRKYWKAKANRSMCQAYVWEEGRGRLFVALFCINAEMWRRKRSETIQLVASIWNSVEKLSEKLRKLCVSRYISAALWKLAITWNVWPAAIQCREAFPPSTSVWREAICWRRLIRKWRSINILSWKL